MVLPELHDAAIARRKARPVLHWAALALLTVCSLALFGYWEADLLRAAKPVAPPGVFKLSAYAHIVLFVATAFYVWHLWTASAQAGAWASRLTTAGAIVLALALATRWIETYYLHRPGRQPFNAGYEMMALFSVVTIVFYLIMERVYRTRMAGAFVMTIVLAALLFQIWQIGSGQAIAGARVPVVRDYRMYAHVLGQFVGYGAFALAAAMGAAWLVRSRAERGSHVHGLRSRHVACRQLPDLARIEDAMHKAVTVGLIVFGVATVLGALSAYDARGNYRVWDAKEIWVLVVCLVYATVFYGYRIRKWDGRRLAWWSLAGFAVTALHYVGARA